MIWTADRIVFAGRALCGMGIDIAPTGRIRRIAPLSELPAAQHSLEGQAIVLGRVNPYHQSLGLLHRLIELQLGRPVFFAGGADGGNDWDPYAHRLSPKDLYIAARAAFLAAAMQGVTTLGEVLTLRYTPSGEDYPDGQGMVDAIVQAAQHVGLRVGLIDSVRLRQNDLDAERPPRCVSAEDLDSALGAFDSLVSSLLASKDPRLSWALGVHSLESVSYEALVAMRLRLGHMPFFLPAPVAPRAQARAQRQYGQHPMATLARRRLLDACVSFVTPGAVSNACLAALAEAGTSLCLCPAARSATYGPLYRSMRSAPPHIRLCLATGSADVCRLNEALVGWPGWPVGRNADVAGRQRPNLAAEFERLQRVAAAALGVDAGDLTPGNWGDFISIALPKSLREQSNLKNQILAAEDEPRHSADCIVRTVSCAGPEGFIRHVVVGGVPIVQNQYHELKAQSDAAMMDLVARLV